MIFLHLLTVQNGGIKRSSLEVLSRGRELVDSNSQNSGQSNGENSDGYLSVWVNCDDRGPNKDGNQSSRERQVVLNISFASLKGIEFSNSCANKWMALTSVTIAGALEPLVHENYRR